MSSVEKGSKQCPEGPKKRLRIAAGKGRKEGRKDAFSVEINSYGRPKVISLFVQVSEIRLSVCVVAPRPFF